jgi:hypothetical protein
MRFSAAAGALRAAFLALVGPPGMPADVWIPRQYGAPVARALYPRYHSVVERWCSSRDQANGIELLPIGLPPMNKE